MRNTIKHRRFPGGFFQSHIVNESFGRNSSGRLFGATTFTPQTRSLFATTSHVFSRTISYLRTKNVKLNFISINKTICLQLPSLAARSGRSVIKPATFNEFGTLSTLVFVVFLAIGFGQQHFQFGHTINYSRPAHLKESVPDSPSGLNT